MLKLLALASFVLCGLLVAELLAQPRTAQVVVMPAAVPLAVESARPRQRPLPLPEPTPTPRPPGVPIHGVVVDEDGAPLAHARVNIGLSDEVETDDAGGFVGFVEAGTYAVTAQRGRHCLENPVEVTVDADDEPHDRAPLRIVLREGYAIGGVVRDEQGEPIGGALISLELDGEDATVTDRDGRYRFPGVCRSSVSVFAHVAGRFTEIQPVVLAADRDDVDFVLATVAHLQGRVISVDGAPPPVGRVRLRIADDRGSSSYDLEADGLFAVEAPAGATLRVRAYGHNQGDVEMELTLRPGEVRDVTLRLEPRASVEGIVRNELGAPVEGALVRIYGTRTRTDAQGRYRLLGLPPGQYSLVACLPRNCVSELTPIELAPNERRRNVDLVARTAPAP